MRAREGGASIMHFASGLFPLCAAMAKGRTPTHAGIAEYRSGSDTANTRMQTRMGVVRGRNPKERG